MIDRSCARCNRPSGCGIMVVVPASFAAPTAIASRARERNSADPDRSVNPGSVFLTYLVDWDRFRSIPEAFRRSRPPACSAGRLVCPACRAVDGSVRHRKSRLPELQARCDLKVLFYGRLAEAIGSELEIHAPPGCSVAELRERLIAEHPRAEQPLRARRALTCVGDSRSATPMSCRPPTGSNFSRLCRADERSHWP